VAILCRRASVVLADEPAAALDPSVAESWLCRRSWFPLRLGPHPADDVGRESAGHAPDVALSSGHHRVGWSSGVPEAGPLRRLK
jgi:hypothetical protein